VGRGPHIQIVDLTGRERMRPLSHPHRVSRVAWSHDGQLLASGCHGDVNAYIWDGRTGELQAICKGLHVAFSHRGDLLASSNWDGTTRLWDPGTGRQLVSADGHALHFSRDDRWLGFDLYGPSVGRWEVADGQAYRRLHGHKSGGAISCLDISPDGRLLASGPGSCARLRDLAARRTAAVLPVGTNCALFDRSNPFLISGGNAGLYRWAVECGKGATSDHVRLRRARAVPLPRGWSPQQCALSDDGLQLILRS